MKKLIMLSLAAILSLGAVSTAFADADDISWVNKCIRDNKNEGQADSVIIAYCSCMNNQMSSTETQSITAWEKTHKPEMEKCSKQAGWVGK